ncbi:TPA: hypothetical protein ACJT8R_003119 [Legionella pneumophila]|uniref:hypothetical protein n=1 Tax=Legionella pneumophila TaxID=446 RepID=UPI00048443E9|nr:hypothetical protein [Legionella pneumophila]VEB29538.1 Uncharacterised protein [Legionella pneumophila]HAT1942845.1 hypothetical protein [Legionella pneumophila]HAT8690511.1 hypothetical protein [Legionella pneumophila]HAT8728070.1 hypothetical protein [Legionella pneumophila]HAT9525816.1 hypothetical protein [Legionella pneumophila subsp. pneumophila]
MKKVLAVCSNSLHRKTFLELVAQSKLLNYNVEIILIDLEKTVDTKLNFGLLPLKKLKYQSRYISYLINTLKYVYFNANYKIQNILNSLKPDFVLLGNDTGHFERSIIRVAKRNKITTLLLQDGLLFSQIRSNKRTKIGKKIFFLYQKYISRFIGSVKYGFGGCDIFLSIGKYWSDIIHDYGDSLHKQLYTVSSPYYESFIKPNIQSSNINEYVSNKSFCITYFLTNFLTGLNDKMAHELQLCEIKNLYQKAYFVFKEHFNLILKIHPEDICINYISLAQLGLQIEITKSASLDYIFSKSDLCITNFSSVFIQAYFNHKICLLSNIGLRHTKYSDFILSLNLPTLNSIEDFENLLLDIKMNKDLTFDKAHFDKQMKGFIDFDPDKSSSERVLELLNTL